jgi:hypothetical protein
MNNNNVSLLQTQIYNILLDDKSFEETKYLIDNVIKRGGSLYKPLNSNGDYVFHVLVYCIVNHINNNLFKYRNNDIGKKCYYFINLDCNVELINNNYETPLYYLCTSYTKNIVEQKKLIIFLLDCGCDIDYCYNNYDKPMIIDYLENEIDVGYNKYYIDIFYSNIIDFLKNFKKIIHYCLSIPLYCFKYILRNNIIDIKRELLLYSNTKIKDFNINKNVFYKNNHFCYKKTFLYLVNNEKNDNYPDNILINNKYILKYIKDSYNIWNPSNHYIKELYVKQIIYNMFLIKNRLILIKKDNLYLPDELWFNIFTFL